MLGFNDNLKATIAPTALYMCVAAGAVIMVMSILGCVSAQKNLRCGLALYAIVVAAVIVTEVAAGAILLTWMGDLKDIKAKDGTGLVDKFDRDFDAMVNTTYMNCCVDDPTSVDCNWVASVTPNCVKGSGLAPPKNGTYAQGFALFKTQFIDFVTSKQTPNGIALISFASLEMF